MQDHELERLFERFRRAGDVAALGAIFDATAPELLRVAMSLVPDVGEADDLLQETFLTAIERAERYEAGRRLVPWLLGLLVHHAKARRRLRQRVPDAARLDGRSVAPPETPVLACELEDALERALDGLGARDRALLEAHLRQGKGAVELAAELGSAPGAVRMRIHRGLERLREALPAGLALGGALGTLGLERVRAAVLRAGAARAGGIAPGAGSAAGAGVAGGLVGKKLVLAAARWAR